MVWETVLRSGAGKYSYPFFRAVIGQGFWASGRNFSGYPFSREFPRLAIYMKSWAEGPAFGVYREPWEFPRKRNSLGNGFEDMSS